MFSLFSEAAAICFSRGNREPASLDKSNDDMLKGITLQFSGSDGSTVAAESSSEQSSQPSSPSGGRITLLCCPLHDALCFFLNSSDMGRLSLGCTMLRSELTVSCGQDSRRRLMVPVVDLRVESAEAELERVSLPHIHILRIFNRLPLDAIAAAAKKQGKQSLRGLEKFICKGCPMDAQDVKKILAPILLATSGLKLLNLEKNKLMDPTVKALCDSGILGKVEMLNLRFNEIGNGGAFALARCPDAKKLKWINLKMNRVTDDGAVALASMVAGSTSMTLFNIRRQVPGLTDKSAYGFAEMLKQNKSLQMLRFRRNRITDKGAIALADASAERLKRLCAEVAPYEEVFFELDLEQNRVDNAGGLAMLQAAAVVPKRARVQLLLAGNPVTQKSLRDATAEEGLCLDASNSRVWFDSKPEFDL